MPSGNIPSPLGAFASFPSTTFDFFPFAGLHRPVVLYSVPQSYIEDVAVVTGIDGTDGMVRVSVRADGAAETGQVTLIDGNQTVTSDLSFGEGAAETTLNVPDVRLWSDKDPYLYDLTIQTDSDRYTLQIGIRTVEVRGKDILLNG